MTILLSALILGLMGSFHCAGMCGPIAISLPLHGASVGQKIWGGILYNLGRTFTYAIMGALFGLVGQGLQLIGFQQWVSVTMGSIMVLTILFPKIFAIAKLNNNVVPYMSRLKKTLAGLFSVKSFRSLWFIGMLNGLLPCGLVYMAIAGAIGVGGAVNGSLFMILFGLGTIPMLLFISMAGNVMSHEVRKKINGVIPVLVVVVGLLFILRGLSLGIPYLSPPKQKIEQKFEKSLQTKTEDLNQTETGSCCQTK